MRAGEAYSGGASLRAPACRRAAAGSFFRGSHLGSSADPQGPVALPDGAAVVSCFGRGGLHAGRGERGGGGPRFSRKSPAAASSSPFAVKGFSRLACLAFPAESADAFCRMGYARLQLLLGYVVPELLDQDWFAEDDGLGSGSGSDGEARSCAGASLHVPYRPYVVVSLNGRAVYRSAIITCGEATASGCPHGIWDERIELQVCSPYLARAALCAAARVTLAAAAHVALAAAARVTLAAAAVAAVARATLAAAAHVALAAAAHVALAATALAAAAHVAFAAAAHFALAAAARAVLVSAALAAAAHVAFAAAPRVALAAAARAALLAAAFDAAALAAAALGARAAAAVA
ncbi:hypothetical protein Efla_001834 [Eimeria flavescens]